MPNRIPAFKLPAAWVVAKNPHPERHAGIVRWARGAIAIPLRFTWAGDHAATSIRPRSLASGMRRRVWCTNARLPLPHSLSAQAAAVVSMVSVAAPNDIGNHAPHASIVVPRAPTKPLSLTIKLLKASMSRIKKKLEECMEENRKAGCRPTAMLNARMTQS